MAPAFQNAIMYIMMAQHKQDYLQARVFHYVDKHTTSQSKLRAYIRDLVRSEGPLKAKSMDPAWLVEPMPEDVPDFEADWIMVRGYLPLILTRFFQRAEY